MRVAPDAEVELADHFCRGARRRVRAILRRVFDNDDVATYAVARDVLAGKHTWMEKGPV